MDTWQVSVSGHIFVDVPEDASSEDVIAAAYEVVSKDVSCVMKVESVGDWMQWLVDLPKDVELEAGE